MHVSPYEPEVPARKGGSHTEREPGTDPPPEMRAAPKADDEGQRGEEIDEPGYGHGV